MGGVRARSMGQDLRPVLEPVVIGVLVPGVRAVLELLAVVEGLVREVHGGYGNDLEISMDSSLDRDLGLDSLTRVELLARLEKNFEVILAEKILFTAETPRDLLRAVAGAKGESASIIKEVSGRVYPDHNTTVPVKAHTLPEVLRWHAHRDETEEFPPYSKATTQPRPVPPRRWPSLD